MAILAFEGFEGSTTTPEFSAETISTTTPHTGDYSSVSSSNLTCTLPTAVTTRVTVGCAFWASQFTTSTSGNNPQIFSLRDSANNAHLTLTLNADGTLSLRRGLSTTGAVIATSTASIVASSWFYFEIQATIADTGGVCKVRMDGAEIISYTGDTRNAGTAEVKTIVFHNNIAGGTWRTDDIYVVDAVDDTAVSGRPDNDFLGMVRVQGLYPNGNGTSSQWVGSDGNSTDNYLLVDEPSANTSDYVASSVVGNRDLYPVTDPLATAGAVLAVRTSAYVAKSDTGNVGVKVVLKESGGSEVIEPQIIPGTTFAHFHGPLRKTKPSGGAWTLATVTNMQVGVEASSGL